MKLHRIKLVTIIAPQRLKKELISLLRSAEISGYTFFEARGRGKGQLSMLHEDESVNLQFKILLPEILATSLMQVVAETYFQKERLIIFAQDADVIRYEKFDRTQYLDVEKV